MSAIPTLVKAGLLVAIVAGSLMVANVSDAAGSGADRGRGGDHRGGHHHHHHHRGGVGVWMGGPFWWPYYGYPYGYGWYGGHPYPYGYSYPVVVVVNKPPAATDTVEKPADWLYCGDSQMFYPHVSECPSGWQTVPMSPPAAKP